MLTSVFSAHGKEITPSLTVIRTDLARASLSKDARLDKEGAWVELGRGATIAAAFRVEREAVYSVWLRVRFGDVPGLTVEIDDKRVKLQRKGAALGKRSRDWIMFCGPWSGNNFLRLGAGDHRLTVLSSGRPQRLIKGPGQKPAGPPRVGGIYLSTFLVDAAPLTDVYGRLLVREAKLQEMLFGLMRLRLYISGKAAPPPEMDELAGDALALRERLVGLFRLHDRLLEGEAELTEVTSAWSACSKDMKAFRGELDKIGKQTQKEITRTQKKLLPAPSSEKPPGTVPVLFTVDDIEEVPFWDPGSPKWNAFEPLRFDGIAHLRNGRYAFQINPREGEYTFELVDEEIEVNRAHGYGSLLFVDPYPVPRWLIERHGREEIIGLYPNERAGWGWANIWSPMVTRWAKDYFRHVGEHFRDNDEVLGYAFYNEPRVAHGTGRTVLEAFRRFLHERHGGIEELNRRWGSHYEDSSEIGIPEGLTPGSEKKGDTGLLQDYLQFRMSSFAEYCGLCVRSLQAGDPNHTVMSRFGPGFMSDPAGGLDFYRLAAQPWNAFSMHDDLIEWWRVPDDENEGRLSAAAVGNYVYSFNRYFGHLLANDECHWIVWDSRNHPGNHRLLRAAVRREYWREIAWGKSIVNNERGLTAAWADWDDAVLDLDLVNQAPRYESAVIPIVRGQAEEMKHWLFDSEILNDGIGIIEPLSSLAVAQPMVDRSPRLRTYPSSWETQYLAVWLLKNHYQYAVVPEGAVLDGREDLAHFRALFLPYGTHIPDHFGNALADWIKAGGTLIAIGPPAVFDEYGRPSKSRLAQLYPRPGLKLIVSREPETSRLIVQDGPEGIFGPAGSEIHAAASPWIWRQSFVGKPAGMETVLRYNDSGPGLVVFKHGQGTLIATYVSLRGVPHPLTEFVRIHLDRAIGRPLIRCGNPDVVVLFRKHPATGSYVIATNYNPTKFVEDQLIVSGIWRVRDLDAARDHLIPTQTDADQTIIPLVLAPGGSVAFHLSR